MTELSEGDTDTGNIRSAVGLPRRTGTTGGGTGQHPLKGTSAPPAGSPWNTSRLSDGLPPGSPLTHGSPFPPGSVGGA